MKRMFLLIFTILFIGLIPSKSFSNLKSISNNLTLEEDIEIDKLKAQVKLLEEKIKTLEKTKAVKLKKNKSELKIGLALSGGGAKGLAHVGVLKVLEEQNIKIDYITGTSMGAVVASLYSAGYTPDQIENILIDINWNGYISGELDNKKIPLEKKLNNQKYAATVRYDKEFNLSLPKGFGSTEIIYLRLKKLLANVDNINDFDKLPIPLRIVATDLNSGKAVALSKGDLARAITASVAIPTILDPVEINGNLYVDGLISRNLPVEDVINMGADIVIASDVGNEVKDNKDYNILSVMNQLVTIQSASSTQHQREMATILISPDIQAYNATDMKRGKEFITLGFEAAQEKIPDLKKLPKRDKIVKAPVSNNNIYIENIMYSDKFSPDKQEILNNLLAKYMNKSITDEEMEDIMLKLYGIDFINKIYYEVEGNTLILDADINPANVFGIGASYATGYGTTFNIGTELSNAKKLGSSSTINAQFGDYLGLSTRNFFYYGVSNKIGIFANASYKESPLYLYDNTKKISDYTTKALRFETGVLTQYDNQLLASYGIAVNYSKLEQETGLEWTEQFEYSKNYNEAFFKLSLDRLSGGNRPTSGVKGELNYVWGGTFGASKSNFYGPLYQFDGYIPINKKFNFSYGFYGGVISGDNILLDQYIKLGGTKNHIQNKEFAFYGYEVHQKLVDQFLIGRLGLDYEISNNLYLGTNWNIGTFREVKEKSDTMSKNDNLLWDDYHQGFALSLTYETMFGPIELSVSKDNKRGDVISQFSIGYILD
ncbi:patatin-like phospholipase family protein [uncultured Fusobacterium sp.]|uniref:patatin-like phospholipase family protein n=1 Tax=uncultured Fusobacterium sp. TaxID=159267 RepID=UPI0025D83DAD|nr:patatin-like phospholipase family protein [uncultured Fusobacterium sp.]